MPDRRLPVHVGGYPFNYGFVPGTVAHDGDPLDVLILGSALPPGDVVQGRPAAVMHMGDEGGYDGKVVMVPKPASKREPDRSSLDSTAKARIAAFFARYKAPEAAKGKGSRVTGWGDACEARKLVALTSIDATPLPRR